MNPQIVQVALKEKLEAQMFTISKECTVLRLLHLLVGPFGIPNVSFLVADAGLAKKDLLIGQLVLKHLGIDSETMLEKKSAQLNETDCFGVVRDATASFSVGFIWVAGIKRVKDSKI